MWSSILRGTVVFCVLLRCPVRCSRGLLYGVVLCMVVWCLVWYCHDLWSALRVNVEIWNTYGSVWSYVVMYGGEVLCSAWCGDVFYDCCGALCDVSCCDLLFCGRNEDIDVPAFVVVIQSRVMVFCEWWTVLCGVRSLVCCSVCGVHVMSWWWWKIM